MRFAGETYEMAALFRLVSSRRMHPAANLIQARANSSLTLDMARRHTQRLHRFAPQSKLQPGLGDLTATASRNCLPT